MAASSSQDQRPPPTLLLDIEACNAERPTRTLRGTREAYTRHAVALESALRAALPTAVQLVFRVNNSLREGLAARASSSAHRAPPSLPPGCGGAAPRVGAFEVSYRVLDSSGAVLGRGMAFSKLRSQRWPKTNLLVRAICDQMQVVGDPSANVVVGGLAWPVSRSTTSLHPPTHDAATAYRSAPSLHPTPTIEHRTPPPPPPAVNYLPRYMTQPYAVPAPALTFAPEASSSFAGRSPPVLSRSKWRTVTRRA